MQKIVIPEELKKKIKKKLPVEEKEEKDDITTHEIRYLFRKLESKLIRNEDHEIYNKIHKIIKPLLKSEYDLEILDNINLYLISKKSNYQYLIRSINDRLYMISKCQNYNIGEYLHEDFIYYIVKNCIELKKQNRHFVLKTLLEQI